MHNRAMAELEKKGPDAWSSIFGEFTSRSYSAPSNDWEELFWGDSLYEQRLAWLAANEARVRKVLGMAD
jgi:hypothetical protein